MTVDDPAYMQGYRGYEYHDLKLMDNPYPVGQKEHRKWTAGWYAARNASKDNSGD